MAPFAASASSSSEISIHLHQAALTLPDGRCILHPSSFAFYELRYAIVGPNGSGKTLLGELLMGLRTPSAGRVERHGRWYYVRQQPEAGLPAGAQVIDLLGLAPWFRALERVERGEPEDGDIDALDGRWQLREHAAEALAAAGLSGLHAQSPLARLSGGERTRIALAGAFLSGADGLLLDEPSNHLDAGARTWLSNQLQRWPGHIITISHDRALLEQIPVTVALQAERLARHGGNYASWQSAVRQQQAAISAELDHLRAERKRASRERSAAHDAQQRRHAHNQRQGSQANLDGLTKGRRKDGAQAYDGRETQKREQQRQNLDNEVRETFSRLLPDTGVVLALPQSHVPANRRVLTCERLRLPCHPPSFPALDLCLNGPVRIGITGPNGAGKSTFLDLVAGELRPVHGRCETGVRCARIDQNASAYLPAALSVLQALSRLNSPLTESELRTRLAQLGLAADTVTRPSAHYSGGERMKAALACALWGSEPAQLLLLDEPGNHLDLPALEALEHALIAYPGALMVVSHDTHFLNALALTHRLHIGPGGWRLEPVSG
ncbi:ATP-binding cassette domain-containing protein [Enterobacillus tribolii]|nr:ATP-binding cassette domain-containing protein [Enterobacillus tribolii]MBW7981107.1 ABC-F family ATP-binding cassette domain-containing protein [Enterobacillus tribolii]